MAGASCCQGLHHDASACCFPGPGQANMVGMLPDMTSRFEDGSSSWTGAPLTEDMVRSRYSKAFLKGKNLEVIARGTRRDMEYAERFLTSRWPGPLNFERHAGAIPPFSPGPLDGR